MSVLGLVVDAVSDVIVARDEQVVHPEFGANVPTENIIGLVGEGDEMVMLLDIVSLLEMDADEAGGNRG